MKKKFRLKMKWHAAVITGLVLLLSVASWGQFKDGMTYYLAQHFAIQTAAATRSSGESAPAHSVSSSDTKEQPASTGQEAADTVPGDKAADPAQRSNTADIESDNKTADSPTADKADSPQPSTQTGTAANQAQNSLLASTCHSMDRAVLRVGSWWSVYANYYLSRFDALTTYYGVGEISSSQVLAGSDNWLFYKTKSDGNPIADFEGTNSFTKQETDHIASLALSAQEEAQKRGMKFAILVAPNKESIYWENMPKNYRHAEISRTDGLIENLSDQGVNIVSPKQEMLAGHKDSQLYYRYDSHWNQLGGYIGVRNILSTWNISMPSLADRKVQAGELRDQPYPCVRDDLAGLAGLESVFTDEKEYHIDGCPVIDWEAYNREQYRGEISHMSNPEAPNKKSVFLVGDSYRSAMLPALSEQFANVYVIHRDVYRTGMIDEVHPDYVIAEYVERYSDRMPLLAELFG